MHTEGLSRWRRLPWGVSSPWPAQNIRVLLLSVPGSQGPHSLYIHSPFSLLQWRLHNFPSQPLLRALNSPLYAAVLALPF